MKKSSLIYMIGNRFIPFLALFIFSTITQPLAAAGSSDTDANHAVRQAADYYLQPLDLLHVQVFQEDDLTRDVRVSQNYTITLPLIGTLDVRNKTLHQTELLVHALYGDYLVNPQVTIVVGEYAKRTVNVLGSVGFSRLADQKHVKLTRTRADGQTENFIINAEKLIQGTSENAWLLQKDDVIYVPERIL
jgi:polysaccharide export outer membrane protein